jgi:Na+/H+-dicarboxylate symporter
VLVFALVFGAALARIDSVPRETLLNVFRGIDAAVTIILSWVVTLAPAGVFALGFSLAARSGGGIVAALAYYVTVSSLTMVAGTAVLYAVVFLATGTSPVRFAKAAAQAQTVAFGTHSSLASLPAMIEGSETLGLSPTARNLVLPMALALFKYSGPMWFIVIVHFMSALSGTPVDATRTASVVFTAVVTSFAIGGVPSGAAFVAAPVLTAAGLPLAGLGIILAVDPIPNAFRTVANVTGMLALATLANGKTPRNPPGSGPTAPRPAATP